MEAQQLPVEAPEVAQAATPQAGDGQRSLYRRHRPRTFADVVGQDQVVRTLHNAVAQGKVHHAYLFVGSRGTGKTSMAKILASCLNCINGPTTEPCGACESCRAVAEATSLDVIEMDAASNNSVDDIRELRDRIAFAPVSGRHKVYILDEAHMLTHAAWNAFLKTLEEPPANTVFVLATTDAQKVPATVIDRCHRFDFRRPGTDQISTVLTRVAALEQIEISPEAIAAIARSATGSFRDALGTLEQLVTYSGTHVALDDVLAVLGLVDFEVVEGLLDAVACGDGAGALGVISACVDGGRDAGSLASDLEGRSRDVLVSQALGSVPRELSLTPEADARLAVQAESIQRVTLVRLLDLLARAREATRAGADARTQLELALVKAASPAVDTSAAALMARIESLEARLAPGGAAPPDPAQLPQTFEQVQPAGQAEPADHPEHAGRAEPAHHPEHAGRAEPAHHPEPAVQAEPVDHPEPAGKAEPARQAEPADDLDSLRARWSEALDLIRTDNALTGALIADGQPVRLEANEVTIAFPPTAAFSKRKAEDRGHHATLTDKLSLIVGRRVNLSYELRDGIVQAPRTPGEEELIARLIAELDAVELS
jgi:DNA polymerase-3 subunit gamma/tau